MAVSVPVMRMERMEFLNHETHELHEMKLALSEVGVK